VVIAMVVIIKIVAIRIIIIKIITLATVKENHMFQKTYRKSSLAKEVKSSM
jgi:hypothetical protein